MDLRPLGKSGINVSPIGLGCWQFSKQNGMVGGFWKDIDDSQVADIVDVSLNFGVNWFDTAEVYGWGASERSLIKAFEKLNVDPDTIHIADKWWPLFKSAKSIPIALKSQLKRMNGYNISLYQIHNPLSISSLKTQLNYLADALEEKKINSIGVSNFSARKMEAANRILLDRNIILASNQVKFHILDRKIENNGILDVAKDTNISIIAYSPLAQGLLSGKFHIDPKKIKERPGPRKWLPAFNKKGLINTFPLINLLGEIGKKYGKTCAQVALNWVINVHGNIILAIPGASKLDQAADNARSMNFKLSPEEIDQISNFQV